PGDAGRARAAECGVRGAVRIPLRRVRRPAPQGGDPRGAAGAHRQHARAGVGHGRDRAVRDRGGPVAQLLASYTTDWLDLVFRWFHATAVSVWSGPSFYVVALDNHLREPEREKDRTDGVSGESWEIHGGGFYRIHKFR